ncbi:NACHT, LRR and PYD domains-containing protein 13 [Coemansia helicoidea]|uniref:NACHT, LRR and PYD domains-containing protein 13 n=1 Tax=Coemansia helicoidea TaxID=1286919 RepID=A0ACC1L3S4_9FUNG|nr:NACHT, LRR and PYD domains-containing protein 13 [Coemansia helicoidea]
MSAMQTAAPAASTGSAGAKCTTPAHAAPLSKCPSSASLDSSPASDADGSALASATLCEQASSEKVANTHSREIAFIDLSPAELDMRGALGGRAAETIECLRVNRCRMDGHSFAVLVDALCRMELPNLHTVDVSQNHIGGAQAGAALAKLLSHARAVRALSLGWNRLALADLGAIATSSAGPHNIRHLDLRANPLAAPSQKRDQRKGAHVGGGGGVCSDAWIAELARSMPQLTHLLLAQATINDNTLVALLHALTSQVPQLEYIGLEWLGLGGRLATVRSIMSQLAPANLAARPLPLHLNLASNNLGDSGVKIIAESGAMLSSLTLACNFITERGTGILAEWLPASGLTGLELSDNHFGDQGVSSLLATDGRRVSADSPYTTLTSLGLNSCCLGDASLRMLTDALDCNWASLASLRILRNGRISRGARIPL